MGDGDGEYTSGCWLQEDGGRFALGKDDGSIVIFAEGDLDTVISEVARPEKLDLSDGEVMTALERFRREGEIQSVVKLVGWKRVRVIYHWHSNTSREMVRVCEAVDSLGKNRSCSPPYRFFTRIKAFQLLSSFSKCSVTP